MVKKHSCDYHDLRLFNEDNDMDDWLFDTLKALKSRLKEKRRID